MKHPEQSLTFASAVRVFVIIPGRLVPPDAGGKVRLHPALSPHLKCVQSVLLFIAPPPAPPTSGSIQGEEVMRQPSPRLPLEQAGVGQPSLPRASLHTGLARNIWGPAQPRGPEAQRHCLPRAAAGRRDTRVLGLARLGAAWRWATPCPVHLRGVLSPARQMKTLNWGVTCPNSPSSPGRGQGLQ